MSSHDESPGIDSEEPATPVEPTPAARERIDMAFFAAAPGFVRASIRLSDLDAGKAAGAAARMLAKASRDARDVEARAWRDAYTALGLPEGTLPPNEALAAWARRPGGVPSQGPLSDLAHATALRHGLPVAVYDLAAIQGDLWLRPARGVEIFEGLAEDADSPARPDTVTINEPVLADGGDRCLARAWHGAQSIVTIPTSRTREALIHLDALDGDLEAMQAKAAALARLIRGFLGGAASVRLLWRELPMADWRT